MEICNKEQESDFINWNGLKFVHFGMDGGTEILVGGQQLLLAVIMEKEQVLRMVFSDMFKILRTVTVSSIISISLSTWNNSAPTGWNCMKFHI